MEEVGCNIPVDWVMAPGIMGAGTANPLQLEQCMLSTSPSQRREDGFGDLDIPTTADTERPHETEGGVL